MKQQLLKFDQFNHDVIRDAEDEVQIGFVSESGDEKTNGRLEDEPCQITAYSSDNNLIEQTSEGDLCYIGIDNNLKGIGGLQFLGNDLRADIKKTIDRLSDMELSAVFACVEHVQESPDDSLARFLATIENIGELSEEKQAMLSAYAKNLREAEKLEKEANYKPAILPKKIKHESVSDGPAKRKQRAPGQNTVRRNYSLSETMANAIQEASQSRSITASLYVEEVMAQQPEVIEILELLK